MKRLFLLLVPVSFAIGQPTIVYEPPSVAKFEVYLLGGKADKRDYHLRVGADWRVGYPFLVGISYLREREEKADDNKELIGLRGKARVALFWKFKNDFSVGGMFDGKNGGLWTELEQVIFLSRSFSLRLVEGYVFGNKEVERWIFAVGFGF